MARVADRQTDDDAGSEFLAIDVAAHSLGSLLFWRPNALGGATASWPKKGRMGTLNPEGRILAIALAISATWMMRP